MGMLKEFGSQKLMRIINLCHVTHLFTNKDKPTKNKTQSTNVLSNTTARVTFNSIGTNTNMCEELTVALKFHETKMHSAQTVHAYERLIR